MKRLAPSILCLYFLLLALFTTLIIVVHLIPRSAIEPHFMSSVEIFTQEGDYPYKDSLFGRVVVDNYTDCYMHNVAFCADAAHPVDAAMRNYRYRDDSSMVVSINHLASGDTVSKPFEYGKYWHGYQIFLRPLLTMMDYGGIRVLNGIVLALLLIIALVLMARRLSVGIAICFIVSLIVVHSAVIPWSLQFSTCYYVMLVSVIALLGCRWFSASRQRLMLCFFAIGASTAFFDFLTTPVMTLGVPLAVIVLKDEKRCHWRSLVALCAMWLLGYSMLWASKWLMAYLLVGYNPLDEVSESVQLHSVGRGTRPMWAYWMKMINLLMDRWSPLLLQGLVRWAIVAILALPAILFPKGRSALNRYSGLVLIAMLTPLWYFVVVHHSFTHFFITSRALLVCWFASLCFLYKNIDFNKLKSHVFNK
jgi:hypothetical protein